LKITEYETTQRGFSVHGITDLYAAGQFKLYELDRGLDVRGITDLCSGGRFNFTSHFHLAKNTGHPERTG